ncbi:hypothetical protein [Streptomyces sp. NPDC058632]|uniref:hypothetical protein n=1 Tax=unclassified Streptomyces TaxID=2593676 RepID=UPI0036525D60
MPPKDKEKKRKSSPTGSDGSGRSDSSGSSLGLRQLFETLPPAPPSDRVLRNAPNLDPESLREMPQRTPWSPAGSNEWFYRVGDKVASGIKSSASSAAKWAAEHDTQFIESVGVGGASVLQGAGIAGQSAAAPANTPGQAAYGGGVTISGLVAAYRGVKELSKLYSNYKHPDREPKKVNYTQMALDLTAAGFAGVYGGYSTGAVQSPGTAQMGMAVGAIGAGLASGAAPWFQNRPPAPTPAPAPPLPPASPTTTAPGGYQLETPYHASMTSLTQQMQGYQLSDFTPAGTRTSSVSTGVNDFYGQPPVSAAYPRQPYQSGSSSQQPYQQGSYSNQQPYQSGSGSQQPYQQGTYSSQQPYQQGTYQSPQNPVSRSVSSYSYYPTDGQNSRQSGNTPYGGGHHGSNHHQKRGGGSGPAV